MPFTTLLIRDFDLIEKILTFKLDDVWVRKYDQDQSSDDFSDEEL